MCSSRSLSSVHEKCMGQKIPLSTTEVSFARDMALCAQMYPYSLSTYRKGHLQKGREDKIREFLSKLQKLEIHFTKLKTMHFAIFT